MAKKKPQPFDALVDEIAGLALLQLVRGESWRRVIYFVAARVAHWAATDKPKLNK